MKRTQVKELMERSIIKVSPEDSLFEASKKMKEAGCGGLPVGNKDDIVGMITDRDIVIRAIAAGRDPTEERVIDYMTKIAKFCREGDSLVDAAKKMRDHRVSRLIVVDNADKACGILSFGKIMRMHTDSEEMTEVIALMTGRTDWRWSQDQAMPETLRHDERPRYDS